MAPVEILISTGVAEPQEVHFVSNLYEFCLFRLRRPGSRKTVNRGHPQNESASSLYFIALRTLRVALVEIPISTGVAEPQEVHFISNLYEFCLFRLRRPGSRKTVNRGHPQNESASSSYFIALRTPHSALRTPHSARACFSLALDTRLSVRDALGMRGGWVWSVFSRDCSPS